MRVFIDTNILIDFVVNREGFSEDADKLFALGINGSLKFEITAKRLYAASQRVL